MGEVLAAALAPPSLHDDDAPPPSKVPPAAAKGAAEAAREESEEDDESLEKLVPRSLVSNGRSATVVLNRQYPGVHLNSRSGCQ